MLGYCVYGYVNTHTYAHIYACACLFVIESKSFFVWSIVGQTKDIIIRCAFFFLSIGRESTTWPANNCLQIMVCSCVVPSKRVLLQIIFCSCVIGTTFSRKNGRSLPWAIRKWLKYENNLGDWMIKQLLNSAITKYHDLPVSRRSIICLSLRLRQIIDLLATDKSWYFA